MQDTDIGGDSSPTPLNLIVRSEGGASVNTVGALKIR
jgi:hypothetical protein